MSKLPQIKPRNLVKFFLKNGFVIKRQVGSHLRLVHPDGRKITIAIHNKPLAPGTFQAILRQANMTRKEFLAMYKRER